MNAARQERMQATESEDERNAITEALATLDQSHRVPLVLHYIEGMTQDEVGKMVGVSQSMIARRLAQGLEILRTRLVQSGVVVSGLTLPQALSQGLLSPSPALQEALASEQFRHLAAAGVRQSVRRARQALFQSGQSGSGAFWTAITVAFVATVVIAGFALWNERPATPPKVQEQTAPVAATLPPAPVEAKTAPVEAKPEPQPVLMKWSFEDAPPQEPLRFSGDWQWGPSRYTGKHILMSSGGRVPGFLCLPVRPAVGRAARIKARFKAVLVLPIGLSPTWGTEQKTLPHTRWGIEKSALRDTKLSHDTTLYVHGPWVVSTAQEGVLSVVKYDGIDAETKLLLALVNAALLDFTYEEMPIESLPEGIRNPEKLIEGKVGKAGESESLSWRSAQKVLIQGP